MKGVGVLAILALCLVPANCGLSEDAKKIADTLGMEYDTDRNMYFRLDEYFKMTAIFNIDGDNVEKQVIQRAFLLYTPQTKLWIKSTSVQMIFYYLDGNSPLKLTTLHADGTSGVTYLGSLRDKRCQLLNCQYELVQLVGSVVKKEVMDPEGWVLLSFIASPNRGGETGIDIIQDSVLRCEL